MVGSGVMAGEAGGNYSLPTLNFRLPEYFFSSRKIFLENHRQEWNFHPQIQ